VPFAEGACISKLRIVYSISALSNAGENYDGLINP
jgi:hypothetical protein